MRRARRGLWMVGAWLTAMAAACGPSGSSGGAADQDGRPGVVCTTAMVGDVVAGVGGDLVGVRVLMGPGVDPHLYRPTRSDVAAIMSADAVFLNGHMLEGKMSETLGRAASGGKAVWAIAERVPPEHLLESDEGGGAFDPHVWMDPVAWSATIPIVRGALEAILPGESERLAGQAVAYAAEIDRLHAYAQRVLSTIPAERRILVTSHDAFGYFGRRYGLEVVGIQGISTESEAGVRDVERIIELLVSRRIGAVFVETTVSDRNIRALIEGAAARGHTVVVGGALFSDAMGAPGTYEGTYIGMIDHNATVVARALGGDAPERGMDGRLGR